MNHDCLTEVNGRAKINRLLYTFWEEKWFPPFYRTENEDKSIVSQKSETTKIDDRNETTKIYHVSFANLFWTKEMLCTLFGLVNWGSGTWLSWGKWTNQIENTSHEHRMLETFCHGLLHCICLHCTSIVRSIAKSSIRMSLPTESDEHLFRMPELNWTCNDLAWGVTMNLCRDNFQ